MAIAIVVGGKNVILEKNAKINFIDTDEKKNTQNNTWYFPIQWKILNFLFEYFCSRKYLKNYLF